MIIQQFDWYQYRIEFSNDKEWDAQLIYQFVKNRTWTDVFDVLIKHWLDPNDKMVHLNEFYPNWRGLNELLRKWMRNGVWSKVLDFLITKAIREWAKAMYVLTWRLSMKAFLF